MRVPGTPHLLPALLVMVLIPAAGAAQDDCPPGYVKGSTTCVPLNLCPDGSVLIDPEKGCSPDTGTRRRTAPPPRRSPPSTQSEPPPAAKESLVDGSRGNTPCVRIRREFSAGSPRRVILSGGQAMAMAEAYVLQTRAEGYAVDWSSLEVIFYDLQQDQWREFRWGHEVDLTLGENFREHPPKRAWERELADLEAALLADPERHAREYEADLFCGSGDR